MNGGVTLMGQMEAGEPLVPNRVRELRENKLMTQAQLARKAKVALRTIHSVEKGMNCRMDTKRKILEALDRIRWYEFAPDDIHLIDNTLGFGHREHLSPSSGD